MCGGYECCLDEAIRIEWRGFSCRKFRAFKPLQLNASEWFLDSLVCLALIGVADHEDRFKQKRRGLIAPRMRHIESWGHILGLS
jgi:hypothetical protein